MADGDPCGTHHVGDSGSAVRDRDCGSASAFGGQRTAADIDRQDEACSSSRPSGPCHDVGTDERSLRRSGLLIGSLVASREDLRVLNGLEPRSVTRPTSNRANTPAAANQNRGRSWTRAGPVVASSRRPAITHAAIAAAYDAFRSHSELSQAAICMLNHRPRDQRTDLIVRVADRLRAISLRAEWACGRVDRCRNVVACRAALPVFSAPSWNATSFALRPGPGRSAIAVVGEPVVLAKSVSWGCPSGLGLLFASRCRPVDPRGSQGRRSSAARRNCIRARSRFCPARSTRKYLSPLR